MQHTPNPAAQLPWADPPLEEHSEVVRQVLQREQSVLHNSRPNLTISPIAVGGAGGGAGAVGELDDAEEAEDPGGPGELGGGVGLIVLESLVFAGHSRRQREQADGRPD